MKHFIYLSCKKQNIWWLQLLKDDDLLLFQLKYHNKLITFGFFLTGYPIRSNLWTLVLFNISFTKHLSFKLTKISTDYYRKCYYVISCRPNCFSHCNEMEMLYIAYITFTLFFIYMYAAFVF